MVWDALFFFSRQLCVKTNEERSTNNAAGVLRLHQWCQLHNPGREFGFGSYFYYPTTQFIDGCSFSPLDLDTIHATERKFQASLHSTSQDESCLVTAASLFLPRSPNLHAFFGFPQSRYHEFQPLRCSARHLYWRLLESCYLSYIIKKQADPRKWDRIREIPYDVCQLVLDILQGWFFPYVYFFSLLCFVC